MLTVCRHRVEAEGLTARVTLHLCPLAEFTPTQQFDAATAILVSQHLVPDSAAQAFFHQLAGLLKSQGALYSADLHIARGQSRELMLDLWQRQAVREQRIKLSVLYIMHDGQPGRFPTRAE